MVNILLIMVNIWLLYGFYMVFICLMMVNNNLVGGDLTILKNMKVNWEGLSHI